VSRAAVGAGADGLFFEVHMKPDVGLSAGGQSLTPMRFQALMHLVRRIAEAVDRTA
jgi:3-deoxy-D-arabino-heptulosonate 7-phosphate (DAHP) synthase